MSEASDGKTGQKRWAMFLAGMTVMQTLYLALTTGTYALTRFKLPYDENTVGRFINMTHNSIELANITGIGIIFICIIISHGKGMRIISIVASWSLFAVDVLVLISYCTGGDEGYLTFYYWVLVLSAFIYGCNQISCVQTYSEGASFIITGMAMVSVSVFLYHVVFLTISNKLSIQNRSYWIVVGQMIYLVTIAGTTAIFWTVTFANEPDSEGGGAGGSLGEFHKALSPILMCILAYSITYVYYPAIAPYKITSVNVGYGIQLVSIFLDSMPSFSNCILTIQGLGPNKKWEKNNVWRHAFWICGCTYVCCPIIFTIILHNPTGKVAKTVRNNPLLACALVLTFNISQTTLTAVGSGGCGHQGDGNKSNGMVLGLDLFLSLSIMVSLSFVGDGYLKTIFAFENDRDNWPTKHFGTWRSFWFWIGSGFRVGRKSFCNVFTGSVKAKILVKKDFLYIIYTDG